MIRRILLLLFAVCVAVLLPWTTYLGSSLPPTHHAGGWRVAWVGLDIGLMLLLVAALWLGHRRHPMATSVMTVAATLLVCDAWFDIVLDWGSPDVWASVASAGLAEIPLAVMLFLFGRKLLSGDMVRHTVTAADLRLRREPGVSAVLAVLEVGPATFDGIVDMTGLQPAAVDAILRRLRPSRRVRRGRGGRWATVPVSLERPVIGSLSPGDRRVVDDFYDDKIQQEKELFGWAADRHADFADWAKGSRSGMWLTERELNRFDREYLDLMMRYSLLHPEPTQHTRELAVRWYAFPTRAEHERFGTADSSSGE